MLQYLIDTTHLDDICLYTFSMVSRLKSLYVSYTYSSVNITILIYYIH